MRDVNSQHDSEPRRFAFQIDISKAAITGVMIVKETDDEIIGSMINEFGVSAIDFSYSKKQDKLKLVNVVSFLNKWYIKLVLKKDIKFCLHVLFAIPYKKKFDYEVVNAEEAVSIINNKRHIKYLFSPLNIVTLQNDSEE